MKYIKSLDGLRGLGIITVLFAHYGVLESAWISLEMFFVLSGYLITRILLHAKEQTTLSQYLKRFYWRRSLRIFPLFYTYLTIAAIVILAVPSYEALRPSLVYVFAYIYNFAVYSENFQYSYFYTHFWSLSVEEQFYLLWPMVIFFTRKQLFKFIIPVMVLVAPVIRYFIVVKFEGIYTGSRLGDCVYWNPLCQMDAFAIGTGVAVFQDHLIQHAKKILLLMFSIFVIAGAANFIALYNAHGPTIEVMTSFGYPLNFLENYQHVWSYSIVDLFFGSLVLYMVKIAGESQKLANKLFENKFFVLTGKISYGMYITHWIIMHYCRKFLGPVVDNQVILFLIIFVIIYGVSYFSFFYYESMFLKLKDKRFKLKKPAQGN